MDPWRWDEGGKAAEQLQRRQKLRAAAAKAGFAGGVDQVLGIAPVGADANTPSSTTQ